MKPPVGTKCAPCTEKGHTCFAQIYVDNESEYVPMCMDCANGCKCSYERVGPPMPEVVAFDPCYVPPPPVKKYAPTIRMCIGEKSPGKRCPNRASKEFDFCSTLHYNDLVQQRKARVAIERPRTTREVQLAIIKEPRTMPLKVIAEKFGVDRGTVRYIWKNFDNKKSKDKV